MPGRGTLYWPPRVARRKEILAKLAEWNPPPALGTVPEVISDPTVQRFSYPRADPYTEADALAYVIDATRAWEAGTPSFRKWTKATAPSRCTGPR